ncbi:hypothetical protein RQM65_06715 [Pricia sp. S334]|uniref:Uncharacterized protein n=1 Tax=Pricia mediterranea TaxID=3076079 RepID=A0ABU3L3M3_9FLAO|nr:hypothetical protein [Pricia sp. S334]MDT7828350.1 hypothetical protein [Pricia sp. S334]
MKNASKISALKNKELKNKEELRGGHPPIDRPRRPTGGLRPPFGKKM